MNDLGALLTSFLPLPLVSLILWTLLKSKFAELGAKFEKIDKLQVAVAELQAELRSFVTLSHHETTQTVQDEKIASLRERVAVLEDRTKRV